MLDPQTIDLKEIDRLVAESVLGWKAEEDCPFNKPDWMNNQERKYAVSEFQPSLQIQHAWEIVDMWANKGRYFSIHKHIDGGFMIRLEIDSVPYEEVFGESDSAPLAICLAGLKDAGADIPIQSKKETF